MRWSCDSLLFRLADRTQLFTPQLRNLKLILPALLLVTLTEILGSGQPADADPIRPDAPSESATPRVHNALFETWLPADSLPLPDSLRAASVRLRDGLWVGFSRSPAIRSALADLESSATSSCVLPRDTAAGNFSD